MPAEVEWNTSNFDKHGHNISVLIEHNGFLIVLEKDRESFPVEQVQLDKNDFIKWFQNDAKNIANETVQSIKTKLIKNKEPQIFIYYMRSKGTGRKNRKKNF